MPHAEPPCIHYRYVENLEAFVFQYENVTQATPKYAAFADEVDWSVSSGNEGVVPLHEPIKLMPDSRITQIAFRKVSSTIHIRLDLRLVASIRGLDDASIKTIFTEMLSANLFILNDAIKELSSN